jgi:hypothetical protein
MSTDNLGNFYIPYHFDSQEYEHVEWTVIQQKGILLYNKCIDLINITQPIVDLIADEADNEVTKFLMHQNVMIVANKLKTSILTAPPYSHLMEIAVIIKVNVCELKAQLWACEEIHGLQTEYTNVLRQAIEQFRELFIEWVAHFDKNNDEPDPWHLFNDPNLFL